MDSALKQRLIGAAVLVALAVIFVPMLLEGPTPEDEAQDVPLTLPDAPQQGYETRELPLAPITPAGDAAAEPGAAPGTATDDGRLATVEAGGEPAPRMDGASAALPAPQPVAPAADADADAGAQAANEPDPEPTPATAPAAQPPAAPAPAAAATPTAAPDGRYAVNAGVYGNAGNARTLVAAFRQAGLPAYAEDTQWQGRAAQRVRIGPYASRAEAESVRLKVRGVRSDVPTSVIALESAPRPSGAVAAAPARTGASAPATAAPAPAPRAAPETGFAVQVAAFSSQGDANAMRDRVRGAGFSALVEDVRTERGTLYRVRVGPTAARAEAERLRSQLSQRLGLNGNVVSYP
ncbi:SPOR domain-containing protein [Coralloluteibacterium stylophorae]|uniref:SPOR domain-containing protein n=1 Tax=Coralloluteibacterium stylophorae TaxID=1776034 RepID=A0A8J8AZR6_9GAMM|nr:SPOR domain-containing protein [Coralloluteibacterium stylophorae]MBS7456534.1 SPOR domain-containing protein [Coralloluteibacterium stylophorae]